MACTGTAPTSPPTSPPPSSPPPSSPPPSSPPPSSSPPTTTAPPGPPAVTHVDNPFAGAVGYLNPDYQKEIADNAPTTGTLGAEASEVANIPSAVWLDSMSAVTGTATRMSLQAHLDAALAQEQADGQQLTAEFVIYDLPNRDCAALASNGELRIAQNGLSIYESQYIDPIAALMSDPKYQNVRIVTVVEPDSLPNLVTNLSIADCAEANSSGAYRMGIQYALNKLHAIPNVYTYIDLGHYAWLGWDSNFNPAVTLITGVIKGTTAGVNSVDGFISDTAGYSTTTEPFMTANQTVGGQPVRSAHFYQFNTYIDEASYDTAMYNAFVAQGFPASIGMLIDTSRNGWGGAARPAGPSTSTTLDTFVNDSRIDRRPQSGGWCNQSGAGLGTRPVASPMPHFDAFVWIKPPGESDGTSDSTATRFDAMCDPNAQNRYDNSVKTNALPGAPQAGQWFEAEFEMLLGNAFPAL
ncbi:MAG TPA: glycoside hydrolase family 6 protein [Mycobacteriales bacterium]|nr:glycoside hydrolase family 6 protein [Mycobacteriales bacterium]